ncbi:MAG: hypothetical protein ACKVHP_07970 [Verrucomicrobiales bacterium]
MELIHSLIKPEVKKSFVSNFTKAESTRKPDGSAYTVFRVDYTKIPDISKHAENFMKLLEDRGLF